MLTPREATVAPTQRSRSPLSPTEVTELATVRLFLVLSALLCSLRPGFCIVCDFAHARPIMLQHSTSSMDFHTRIVTSTYVCAAKCYSVRLSFTVTHFLFVMLLKLVSSEVNLIVVTLLACMVTVLLSFVTHL